MVVDGMRKSVKNRWTHKKRDLRLDMGQKSSKGEGNPFVKSQKEEKKKKEKKGKRMISSNMILSQALLMAFR